MMLYRCTKCKAIFPKIVPLKCPNCGAEFWWLEVHVWWG